jgi:hypothetical protein
MAEEDIWALRAQGFSDAAIHDATQVVGYFNYIDRVADGLGIGLETSVPERENALPGSVSGDRWTEEGE